MFGVFSGCFMCLFYIRFFFCAVGCFLEDLIRVFLSFEFWVEGLFLVFRGDF